MKSPINYKYQIIPSLNRIYPLSPLKIVGRKTKENILLLKAYRNSLHSLNVSMFSSLSLLPCHRFFYSLATKTNYWVAHTMSLAYCMQIFRKNYRKNIAFGATEKERLLSLLCTFNVEWNFSDSISTDDVACHIHIKSSKHLVLLLHPQFHLIPDWLKEFRF